MIWNNRGRINIKFYLIEKALNFILFYFTKLEENKTDDGKRKRENINYPFFSFSH